MARTPERARAWHRAYLHTLVERDARDVSRLRDASALFRLLELMALRTGELLNVSSLGNELDMRRGTVDSYLDVAERLFLVRRLQPWFRNEADKDQVEVDLVITRGRQTWGVEVKSAMTAPGDGRGLRRLAEQCGRDFRGGVLVYAGGNTIGAGRQRRVRLARPGIRLGSEPTSDSPG